MEPDTQSNLKGPYIHIPIQYIKSSSFDSTFARNRLPNYTLPSAYFDGCVSYQCNVDYVTITIQKLYTSLQEGKTGQLFVSLLSSDTTFTEGKSLLAQDYDVIVEFKLQPLFAGELYTNILRGLERRNKLYRPHMIIILENNTIGDRSICDWINFQKQPDSIPYLRGAASYSIKGDDVEICVPQICSNYSDAKTGHLQIRLLSSEGKFGRDPTLNSDSYEVVAEFIVDPLAAGSQYTNIRKRTKSKNHLRRKYSILTLSQYQYGAYIIKDWHYFPPDDTVGSVFFSGDLRYELLRGGSSVTISIDKIACNINGYSGGLRVSLIAANKAYMSEPSYIPLEHKTIGSFTAEGLGKDQFYKNVVKSIQSQNSPTEAGKFMIIILETLNTSGKYQVADWRNLN